MQLDELQCLLDCAVEGVFSKALGSELRSVRPEPGLLNGATHVASSVGIMGSVTGVVYLYCADSFARTVAGRLAGMVGTQAVTDEMVNETLGKLANLVAGHVESLLAERGLPSVATIPSIVRGSSFCIEPVGNIERRVSAYLCEAGNLIMEVLVRPLAPSNGVGIGSS